MTTIFRARTAVLAIMMAASPAAAQDVRQFHVGADEIQQPGISVVAVDPISVGVPVIDAPFSAEAVTDMTQHLSDGNRIERRTTATIARSSDGRTRREQQGFAFGGFVGQSQQPIVSITDPTTGVHITLNYELNVAFRMRPGVLVERGPDDGGPKLTMGPLEGRGSGMMIDKRRLGTAAGKRGAPPQGLPIVTFEAGGIASPPVGVGGDAWPVNADAQTETLEPRTIEGLRAEGTRITMTIPAGAFGNLLPIEVVSERWFSPELQILLMTRRTDPRFGETVYRLTNIIRAEPSAELFKVPADFRIEDMRP